MFHINYEYYKIFYYAAKCQNLTQAAQLLGNSQPNLSRTLKLLENQLGISLLIRSNRGIRLTPEGEKLFAHVSIAVEHLQTAEKELQKLQKLEDGIVAIGTSETAMHMLLLPILNQYKKKYPGIKIRISNHLIGQAVQALTNGDVDFAVVATPADIRPPLHQIPVLSFQDILIGGPSYSHLAKVPVSLKDLSACPLVCLGEHTMTYRFYHDFYSRQGLSLKPELEAATTDQILPMIRNDLGIGFLPEIFAKEALEKSEICQIQLKESIPSRQICFIENQNYPLSAAAQELKEMLCCPSSCG
ncbi:MAG: LysR family transcriptional regulator [Lachnospiraceae bacterium]|nr:LysR family transcriptional regulator [Lachnospiraceae bacterium]